MSTRSNPDPPKSHLHRQSVAHLNINHHANVCESYSEVVVGGGQVINTSKPEALAVQVQVHRQSFWFVRV